jgi:hypothetical protein
VNPRDALERAKQFREEFHWGFPARKVTRRSVPPRPDVLVKLGQLESVTYATHKKGDGYSHYEHAFGEEGGRKPQLAVDPDSGKLHIVGGSYRVEKRGIVD